MDSLIGVKGKDFIILAADTNNAYSVLKMKVNSILIKLSNTTIKSGIQTDKNCLPSEVNILMFSYLATIFKKISHILSTKMALNSLSMILQTLSDINQPKPSEKVPIKSIAFQLASKEINQDFIGLITLEQLFN